MGDTPTEMSCLHIVIDVPQWGGIIHCPVVIGEQISMLNLEQVVFNSTNFLTGCVTAYRFEVGLVIGFQSMVIMLFYYTKA